MKLQARACVRDMYTVHEVPRTPMVHYVPPAARQNGRARTPKCMSRRVQRHHRPTHAVRPISWRLSCPRQRRQWRVASWSVERRQTCNAHSRLRAATLSRTGRRSGTDLCGGDETLPGTTLWRAGDARALRLTTGPFTATAHVQCPYPLPPSQLCLDTGGGNCRLDMRIESRAHSVWVWW